MMRVATDVFEVVAPGVTTVRYDTMDEARAHRGTGQVRKRTLYDDVPAEYAVIDAAHTELGRSAVPAEAAALSKANPGSRVIMVAAR